MAIATPRYKIKVICKSCGWHLIVTSNTVGYVTSFDVWNFLSNMVPLCGRCGNKDLLNCAPTILEHCKSSK